MDGSINVNNLDCRASLVHPTMGLLELNYSRGFIGIEEDEEERVARVFMAAGLAAIDKLLNGRSCDWNPERDTNEWREEPERCHE